MNLKQLLVNKLQEGYRVKLCMNSMRVKMCSITKSPCDSSLNFNLQYVENGNGDGPTAKLAILAALKSFKAGYCRSGYSSGDTDSWDILDVFVHSGYNVHLWFDSGIVILQVRRDTLCKIPAKVLLGADETGEKITWKDGNNRTCTTQKGSLSIINNVNFPNIPTYITKTEGVGQWEDSEHHHLFREIDSSENLLEGMIEQKLLSARST